MAGTYTAVKIPLSDATIRRQASFPKPFPFQYLPTEIRLMIYDLVFVFQHPIQLRYPDGVRGRIALFLYPQQPKRLIPRSTMEMLLLNKTISAEIRQVLYSKNTFELSIEYHRGWFSTIGVPNAHCLRSIIVAQVHEGKEQSELVAFQNTLVKRAPFLTDLQYTYKRYPSKYESPTYYLGTTRDGYRYPPLCWCFCNAEMLLDVRIEKSWMQFRFLRSITLVLEIEADSCHDSADDLLHDAESVLNLYGPEPVHLLEQIQKGLAPQIANMARVILRAAVAVRLNGISRNVRWMTAEAEPETPRREPGPHPDIIMSSAKKHAVWRRTTLYKEKRRMERERRSG